MFQPIRRRTDNNPPFDTTLTDYVGSLFKTLEFTSNNSDGSNLRGGVGGSIPTSAIEPGLKMGAVGLHASGNLIKLIGAENAVKVGILTDVQRPVRTISTGVAKPIPILGDSVGLANDVYATPPNVTQDAIKIGTGVPARTLKIPNRNMKTTVARTRSNSRIIAHNYNNNNNT